MADRAEVIANYIQAKDCNRPWMMAKAFSEDAHLEMENKSGAISFPSAAVGIEKISEVLVRQFSRENENVYTVCLCTAPDGDSLQFSCDWLVGMSRKDTGEVRVGCGQYEWVFSDKPQLLATKLKITIEVMQVLARDNIQPVMRWLSGLAYPWCAVDRVIHNLPQINGLVPISEFLGGRSEHR